MLKSGGNKKLRAFLQYYQIPQNVPRKMLYSSKILTYFRRILKAEANGEPFNLEVPQKIEMLEPYTGDSDFKTQTDFNKMMINIGQDHYSNSRSYSSVNNSSNSNSYENKYSDNNSSNEKFTSISSNYKNDSRFASVSSEPFNPNEEVSAQNSTSSYIYSFFGTALNTTKNVAGSVKEKVSELDISSKIAYGGGKTVEVLKYTGSKVYEKGSNIVVNILF